MRRGRRRSSTPPPITADDGSFSGCAQDVELGLSGELSDDDDSREGWVPGYSLDMSKIPPAPVSAPPFASRGKAPHSSQLSLYMVTDKQYQDFLLSRRSRRKDGRGLCGTNCGGDDVGRCCAGFSFIGMSFLLFAGMLIERQPLYVKGIKQIKRYPGSGQGFQRMKGNGLQGSSKAAPSKYGGSTQYNRDFETYKMRKESANAFKAAAAYFLTMVLSMIYAQNHDGINSALIPCIVGIPLNLYERLRTAYFRFRRRHYVDIPDTGNVLPLAYKFQEASREVPDGIPIERKRTFELLRRKVMEMSIKIPYISPKRRRRDLKTKNV